MAKTNSNQRKKKLVYAISLIEELGEDDDLSSLEAVVKGLEFLNFGGITVEEFLNYIETEY